MGIHTVTAKASMGLLSAFLLLAGCGENDRKPVPGTPDPAPIVSEKAPRPSAARLFVEVREADDRPVSQVTVRCQGMTCVTGENGAGVLGPLAPGSAAVEAAKLGYIGTTEQITIHSGRSQIIVLRVARTVLG